MNLHYEILTNEVNTGLDGNLQQNSSMSTLKFIHYVHSVAV